jgi:enamine deaminase RidA (YjgF/YER057c/UK114 family)
LHADACVDESIDNEGVQPALAAIGGFMPLERFQPHGLQGSPLFTHVVKAGTTVYIAGQVAVDQDGQVVGRGDVMAQATQVFENLRAALAAARADISHLAKIVIFATDAGFRDAIQDVRRRYLGSPDPVASTFVVVAGLARPELLVEIDAVAVLD